MTQKLRVLIAEGTSAKAASALRELFRAGQGGLELTEVSGVPTLLASLQRVSPEVIFLDLALASHDVLGSVRMIYRTKPEVPLVVIGDPLKRKLPWRASAKGPWITSSKIISIRGPWTACCAARCSAIP